MYIVALPAAALAASAAFAPHLDRKAATVRLTGADGQPCVSISLRCPRFVLDAETVGGQLPVTLRGDIRSGRPVVAAYAPLRLSKSGTINAELHVQWSRRESVLRKWVAYRFAGTDTPTLVKEIVLEELAPEVGCRQACRVPPQSYPLLFERGFAGVEFPVATTRVEAGVGIVGHCPGVRLPAGAERVSRKAVYGVCPPGEARPAFEAYVARHYTHRKRLHVDYNSWWTTGIPYTEADVLDLMAIFGEKLHRAHDIPIESFCIDMGWSKRDSIWEIDPALFPRGFDRVADGARSMGGNLGLWLSPVAAYPEALDTEWAARQGYHTFPNPPKPGELRLMCPLDARYRDAVCARLGDIARRYSLRHLKLDNYRLECPETDHGHEPGPLSSEAMAESIISMFGAVRTAARDIVIESDAFGAYQSPWWLWYVDVLLSDLGADAPYGLVPCPVYRESYTSARDYHNLRGDALNIVPVADLHVCGLVHQSPDPFLNDGVMTVMRGGRFLPFYVNPAYMTDARWSALADLLRWARRNAGVLEQTHPLPPDASGATTPTAPMVRAPYGYAHWKGTRGLVALRNPWVEPTSFQLHLDRRCGLRELDGTLSATAVYPVARSLGAGLRYGDTLEVALAPYGTVVVSLQPGPARRPARAAAQQTSLRAHVLSSEARRVEWEAAGATAAPNELDRMAGATTGLEVSFTAEVTVEAADADLLLLIEDAGFVLDPLIEVTVNGTPAPVTWSGSDTGWAADVSRSDLRTEQWLFARVPLPKGTSRAMVRVCTRSATSRVSSWVWSHRRGQSVRAPGQPLPEPELVSVDAKPLLPPVSAADLPRPASRTPRDVARIDGVFVDALEGVTAGDAPVQRNLNVRGKPLTVCGRRHVRGLGTIAPARVTVPLTGEHRQVTGWAGVDAGAELWDESIVTFEVHVDGVVRWSSGPMVRNEPTKQFTVDVDGARALELVTVNSGTRKTSARAFNLCDWAEVRLLR